MTQRIAAHVPLPGITAIAEAASAGERVVFEPTERVVRETLRLPTWRHYDGNGTILRAAPDFDGPILEVYDVPLPPRPWWQRLWAWIAEHILRCGYMGPRTLVSNFVCIGNERTRPIPPAELWRLRRLAAALDEGDDEIGE